MRGRPALGSVMLAAAALLLLTGAADPAADRALLEAFGAPCQHVEDYARTNAEAAAAGWTQIAEDADPRIAALAKVGREATQDDGKIAGETYRRTHDGRDVFLMVTRYEDKSGFWGNGCRLYDFDAPGPIPLEVAQGWIGSPPTGTQRLQDDVKYLWEPWVDGRTLELNHVTSGGMVDQQYGLRGVIIVSQAIGFPDGAFGSSEAEPEPEPTPEP